VAPGNKVWKYYGFRFLGGRTYDSTGNAANAMSAVTDQSGTIYLLKVRNTCPTSIIIVVIVLIIFLSITTVRRLKQLINLQEKHFIIHM